MAKLLIVDDDDDLRELLTELLGAEGHAVRTASDGEQGLRALEDEQPDAVVLDVEMPKLGGPAMALRMMLANAGKERIPVLLLSGTADLSRVAREVGTRYFLPKPTPPDVLLATVDRVLREREAPRPRAP